MLFRLIIFFIYFFVGVVGDIFSEGWIFKEIGNLIESGKYSEATLNLQRYISTLKDPAKDPARLAEAYYILGYTYYTYLQDYAQALDSYENAINLKLKFKSRKDLGVEGIEGLEYVKLSQASKGDLYCRLGQYEKAIASYKQVISEDPKGIYGEVYTGKIGSIKNALSQLKQQQTTLKTYSSSSLSSNLSSNLSSVGEVAASAQFNVAELYRQDLNSPEKAIAEYQKLLSRYPDSEFVAEAEWRIGHLYSTILHKPDKAIMAYKRVVENYPMSKLDAESYFQIGKIYCEKLHRFQEALQIFVMMPNLYPTWKLPAVLYWQGICYENLEQYDEAISAWKQFLNFYPNDDNEPHWLQDIGKFGEKDVKLQVEGKIKKLKKSAPEAYWRKAELLYSKGDYTESLILYRKLVSSEDPEYSSIAKRKLPALELLAELQICREKLEKLEKLKAANSAKVSSDLHYRRGEIFETGFKEYRQAIREYQKSVEFYPKGSAATKSLYRMAEISWQKLNDFNKAEIAFKKLIKGYPESFYSTQASYQLGELYRKQLKGSSAVEFFQATLNYPELSWYVGEGYNDSFSDAAGFRIGQTYYYELGDLETAVKMFQNFISTRQRSPRLGAAYAFVGLISEEQRHYASALNYYQKALAIALQSEVQASMILTEFKPDNQDISNSQIVKYLKAKVSQLKKLISNQQSAISNQQKTKN